MTFIFWSQNQLLISLFEVNFLFQSLSSMYTKTHWWVFIFFKTLWWSEFRKKILHYLDWVQELEHTVPQPCKATAEELKKKYTSYRSYTAVLLKLIIYFESSSKNKKRHLTNTFTTNKYIDASGIHVCIFHKQTYGNWITEAEAG